ncbi:MAG: collagen-like protein [Bacilli bacterium]|nr:collagen-like protein [Bacilli bacterium]
MKGENEYGRWNNRSDRTNRPPGPGRLLKWYDFIEVPDRMISGGPAITTFIHPSQPNTFGPKVPIDLLSITMDQIDSNTVTTTFKCSDTGISGTTVFLYRRRWEDSLRQLPPSPHRPLLRFILAVKLLTRNVIFGNKKTGELET